MAAVVVVVVGILDLFFSLLRRAFYPCNKHSLSPSSCPSEAEVTDDEELRLREVLQQGWEGGLTR